MTPAEARDRVAAIGGAAILEGRLERDMPAFDADPAAIRGLLGSLRDDPALKLRMLSDLCGVDYLGYGARDRYAVVYHLRSVEGDTRIRLKCFLPEDAPEIDSATPVFPGAEWLEREVFDLFGIAFRGHPDLRRILMPADYPGHPLRKDYPLEGYGERFAFPQYRP